MHEDNAYSPLDIARYNIELARDSLADFKGDNLNELTKAAIAIGQAHMALMMVQSAEENQTESQEEE